MFVEIDKNYKSIASTLLSSYLQKFQYGGFQNIFE
jgi:hypothetical protein